MALSTTWNNVGLQVYTYDSVLQSALVRWGSDRTPAAVVDWVCLDAVAGGGRIAAMNLSGGYPEVFMISERTRLVVRRETPISWTYWEPFSLPLAEPVLTDVAAVGGALPRVYIADRGRVFFRSKPSTGQFSDYGPWRGLPTNGAALLSATLRADGRHLIVTTTDSGTMQVAIQPTPDATFGPWQGLDTPSDIVDLEVVELHDGGVAFIVLDRDGEVWMRSELSETSWVRQPPGPGLVAIAARAEEGGLHLLGLNDSGSLYRFTGSGWITPERWL